MCDTFFLSFQRGFDLNPYSAKGSIEVFLILKLCISKGRWACNNDAMLGQEAGLILDLFVDKLFMVPRGEIVEL